MCLDSTFDCTCSHTNMIYVHVICHMSDIELLGSTIVCLNPLKNFVNSEFPIHVDVHIKERPVIQVPLGPY